MDIFQIQQKYFTRSVDSQYCKHLHPDVCIYHTMSFCNYPKHFFIQLIDLIYNILSY